MNQILSSCQLLCILFVIFNYSKAATINLKQGETCASVCSGKENIFKFDEGKIYTYNFLSKHSIKNPNAEKETVQLTLTGKADLSKISACDYSLQLSEVVLTESLIGNQKEMKKYDMMKKMLEKYSLRFGFDDGRVVGVCSNNMDNEFAINVKKAILSSLQVSLDSLDAPNYLTETDISGDCITEYTTSPEPPNFVIVKKAKSISGCARKHKYFSTLSGKTFEEPMENRHFALLDGIYNCELKIKRSEGLKESICTETQTFKPFNSDKSGSSVVINQELRFDSVKTGKISTTPPNTRSDLVLDHGKQSPLFMKTKETPAIDIAKQLCIAVRNNAVSTERLQLFVRFVRSLAKAKYQEIQKVDKYFRENVACSENKLKLKKILLDALPHTKTKDAIKFLVNDFKTYKFNKLGFSVTENASPDLIELFSKHLDDPKIENSVSLTLTAMIKGFCEKTPGCMLNPAIIKAMNRLLSTLGNNCNSKNQASLEKILFTLRALGNAGDFPDYKTLTNVLESCVNLPTNDDNIKVFAIEVLRQFPCNADVDTFLWNIYDGVSFSAEIRIQAYLSLVRCPLRETFRKVIQKLGTENSQQLGSFVWSHISNLMETSDRFKTELRDMLQIFTKPMADISKRFNLDFRSYSKNIEKTFQRGYSSAKIDSNVIFSNSPFPSSVTANITIDSFGRSLNVFEFGFRGNTADKLIHMLLKPHGEPHPDVVKMDKKNERKLTKSGMMIYFKVMGREIYFTPNILADITKFARKMSSKETYEKSLLSLDSVVSISSITGFPIELAVESAVSSEFMLSTSEKISYKDFSISTKNNVAIQIIGKLQVNSHCTKVGVQSTGTIASDSEFGGKFKFLTEKKKLDLSVLSDYQFEINKMPDDRKLISISNELKLIHNLKNVETQPQYQILLEKCTGNPMLELRGIKICASVSTASRYGAFFPNLKAELKLNKFNGFRFKLRKENTLKPINKLKSFHISTSFQGEDKDTFKFQFERDLKLKKQLYELSLWNKDIYFQFGIDDQKISGQLKYGENQATISGTMKAQTFMSTMNLNIKTKTSDIVLAFHNKFTKEGPLITITAKKTGDKEFSLDSKTSVKITEHKIFNYFQRFRHSTVLKVAGDNKFSLVLESSKGNNPTMEVKMKLDTFWKTKDKYNFNIKQNFLWTKYSVVDKYLVFENIPGTNYSISLSQELQIRDKKFNLQHNLNYFISNHFAIWGEKPSLVAFKFNTFDLIQQKFTRQINSKFFLDVMSTGKGKVMLQNFINHPGLNLHQQLNVLATWKRNSLDMYDIEAEISESDLFKMLFKHKFTTTQNGISSLEIKHKKLIFKINSELMLPKKHILSVFWKEKALVIESKLNTKSLMPFNTVVSHDITLDKKLIAVIENIVEYNNQKAEFSFKSIGRKSDKLLYTIGLGGQLKHNFISKKVFYDFATNIEVKVPSKDIDVNLETVQFSDFEISSSTVSEKKIFQSKVTYKNNKNDKLYGYETVVSTGKEPESLYKIQKSIYKGSSTDKCIFKFGRLETKYLVGLSIESSNYLNSEFLFKATRENDKLSISVLGLLDLKKNDKFNFYYKNNIVFMYKVKESYSLTWSGEYSKGKTAKTIPTKGSLSLFYRGSEKIVINVDIMSPILSKIKLAKAMFGFNIEIAKTEKLKSFMTSNTIVKWQKEGSRTANYYELKLSGKHDFTDSKKFLIDFEGLVTKDSSLTKLLEITGKLMKAKKSIESNFNFVCGKKTAALALNVNANDFKNHNFLFSIKSSSAFLKELKMSSDWKFIGNTYQGKCHLIFDSTKLYNIQINQIRKIDFSNGLDMVSNVNWKSNVPYLNSGSYILGILVYKLENFKINLNLSYKDAKKLNIKFSTDTKAKEIQVFAESFIVTPMKLFLHGTIPSSNTIKCNSEFGYKDAFLKIQNLHLSWNSDTKSRSSDFAMTILSSNEGLNDIVASGNNYYELEKFITTYKANFNIKYKGKYIHTGKIDLSKGVIEIESNIIKSLISNYFKLDIKYSFNSIRDMNFRYTCSLEPSVKTSQFDFVYFRKGKDEKAKKFEEYDKAVFFVKLQFTSKDNHLKKIIFINENLNKGNIVFKANLPKLKLQKEAAIDLSIEKISESIYTGVASFKTIQYKFKFESFSRLKNKLEINALSKDVSPQNIVISYDIQDNVILKINSDKIFNLDIDIKRQEQGKRTGTVGLSFKGQELADLKVDSDLIVPKGVESITDYLKALFGIKKGIQLKININGRVFGKAFRRYSELYHIESKQFPGGTKSLYKVDVNYDTSVRKMLFSADRNYPMFDHEQIIYIKDDDFVLVDSTKKVKFISKTDFMVSSTLNLRDVVNVFTLIIYNPNIVQTNFLLETLNNNNNIRYGFSFKKVRESSDLSFNLVYNKNNYTMDTNIGQLIKFAIKGDFFPTGKMYYIEVMKKYEFRISRKKTSEFDIKLNYNWKKPIDVNIGLKVTSKEKLVLVLKGTTGFEKVKQFHWKLEYENKHSSFEFSSLLRVNKKTISELSLIYLVATTKNPHTVKVDYKGYRNIKGLIQLNTEKYQFSHSVTAKNGTYKTELWTSKSNCRIKPKIDCQINHKNSAREIVVGTNIEENHKRFELTWNKKQGRSLILTMKKDDKRKIITLENPIKRITISNVKVVTKDQVKGVWNLDIKSVDKSTDKDISLTLNYKMKGSLKTDYKLELDIKTNLIHKEIKISIKRDVSVDIGDLYALEIKASFDNEVVPFFGLKGYLRQLSSRSYELKLNCTNYDKFAILTTTLIFASEEITLEYQLVQSNKSPREFLLQYIPFKKFHITNKNDFKILLSRVRYQYGYRGDYVVKLGSGGTNFVAYSTYTRSPMKYYAEFNTQDQKTVIHIRPVGKSIIGELYRKTSAKKILDSSLKIGLDENDILTSKLYWDPKTLERLKTFCGDILNPKNIRNLMVRAYEKSENQLSSFTSNLKLDLAKSMNVAVSLEFMKGIVNEWEKFPKNIAISYDNDDYFMKTLMTKLSNALTESDIPSKFNTLQSSLVEFKNAVSKTAYEWVIDAKLYSIIHKPATNILNTFTYDHVKTGITSIVDCGKSTFKAFKTVVNSIGDALDAVSKKAKLSLKVSESIKDKFSYFYKNSIFVNVVSLFSEIKNELLDLISKILETDIVKQRIKYYQESLKNSEEIVILIKDFKDKSLKYFKTSNFVTNIVETIKLIRSMKYKEAFLNLVKLEETKFKMNLDEATMELRFYVPPISRRYVKVTKMLISWLPTEALYQAHKFSLGEKLLELFYRYEYLKFNYGTLSVSTLKKLFPPFSKTAWVINGNSILTFDGNAIRIGAGKCSYLLARDFSKKSFSLIMNINSKPNEKEFELHYINKISISQSGQIKVDGKVINILPKLFKKSFQNFVIYRDNIMIKIKTTEGLLIKYFYKMDSFKVKVVGSWHGLIKGLLGSNDFESVNDWSTPNGLITHDAGILSKSWSLGQCTGKTKTGLHTIRASNIQQCVNMFHPDSLSYLKRCYSLISPEPYFELCHRSLQYSTKSTDLKEILCGLSRNYVMRCKASGIMLRLDKSCVKCGKSSLNAKMFTYNLSQMKKFNYIFIMEQSACLKPYQKLVENLANIMGFKSDNIFTLLSYNGNDVFNDVHFKSVDGKINTNKDGFSKLLGEFWSLDQISSGSKGMTSQPGQAIYDAIKMSSAPGYIERIILIGCSACSENQKYIYSLLAGLLNNAGISVTYLTTQPLTGAEADANTFGLGNRLVYFYDKISNTIKNRPWKRNVQAPKDSCSPLARLKQGFVWSMKELNTENKMRRLAEVIHVELEKIKDSTMQSCYCTAGNFDEGSVECKIPKSRQSSSIFF